MALFRFAAQFSTFGQTGIDDAVAYRRFMDRAEACDKAGYEVIFLPDHLVQNFTGGGREAPMFEAYSLCGAIAERTSRIRLSTLVTAVTFRYPALLAKIITTLDVISGGRAMLGLGAGWDASEHLSFGMAFSSTRERMDQLDETCRICRAMFDEEAPTFTGEEFQIVEATNVPRPIQAHIPILVAGGGEKRTLRIAAKYADAVQVFGNADLWMQTGSDDPVILRHKFDVLAQHCESLGRDPREVTKTSGVKMIDGNLDALRRSVETSYSAGAEGILVSIGEHDPDVILASGEALRRAFG